MGEIISPAVATETRFRQLQAPKIGGWLIVVAIGLVVSSLHNLSNFLGALAPITRPGVWARLTDPTSPVYHPYWRMVILYDVLEHFFYVVTNLVALILFFGKRRLFPKLTVALIPTIFVLSLVGYYLEGLIPAVATNPMHLEQAQMLVVRFVALAVWIPYFLLSKRVRQTFIF